MKKKNNVKNSLMYQKFVGTYNAKLGQVFTDEGDVITVVENKPLNENYSFCVPAMDRDRVDIMVTSYEKGKACGRILKVVSRFTSEQVGVVEYRNGNYYLNPFGTAFGSNILISPENIGKAIDGAIVSFIVVGEDAYHNYIVVVNEVIAHKNDANAFVKSMARKYGLSVEFSKDSKKQAARVPEFVNEEDFEGRVDLRNKLTITIDGKDTKDRDDAIRLEVLPNGNYLLGVDIADVDYYVNSGSPIDVDARTRGTSCYAGGQVIPMIPKQLSNGICSLNENVDRLAMTCNMEIEPKSCRLVDYDICQSVIRVNYNMNYDEVMDIFRGEEEVAAKYEDILPMLREMRVLARILQKKAERRGYLEFKSKEAKLDINPEGKLEGFTCHVANEATKLIQSFMIAANITVATALENAQYPCIYRVHDLPDDGKVESFVDILNELGYPVNYDNLENPWKFFQNVIKDIEGQPDEDYLSALMTRTQRKAKYSTVNIGHFGIAEQTYCHFTSPIRRYPDLCVHRALKALLDDNSHLRDKYQAMFEKDAQTSSTAEVKADKVEREVEKIYKCMYMKDHIGEVYTGKISNVSKTGIFVELENTVEGFCFIGGHSKCRFNEEKLQITDLRTQKVYRLGEEVRIKVVAANEIAQTIDFELLN